jgi:sialidase-1
MVCFRIAVVLALALCLSASVRAADEEPFQIAVFTSGQEDYHTFRIPSLITTQKGTLLAFCEGRKTGGSDHGDIDLVLKRSMDAGKTWSKMQVVHEEGGGDKVTIGNPCPVIDEATGTIWLTLCRDNKEVLVTHSKDDGATWAKPIDITSDVKKPDWGWVATGPGVGIQLRVGKHKGRFVIPCDHGVQIDGKRVMVSHVFYSDDSGESWQLGGSLDIHTDECQVVELNDGSLMMNARNYWGRAGGRPERGNMRAISTSKDGGDTWSKLAFDKTLIESICQASFLRYDQAGSGGPNLLLFSNPASKSSRTQMTVRSSSDDGKTWRKSRLLHEGPAAYSCLTVLDDGPIACLYEAGEKTAYETITFERFSLDWLQGQD